MMDVKKRRRIILVVLVVGVYFIVALWRNLGDFSGLDGRVSEVEDEVSELRRENEELKRLSEKTTSDEFVEQEIRDKLGLVKPGEKVVILPEEYIDDSGGFVESSEPSEVKELENWKKWWNLFFK